MKTKRTNKKNEPNGKHRYRIIEREAQQIQLHAQITPKTVVSSISMVFAAHFNSKFKSFHNDVCFNLKICHCKWHNEINTIIIAGGVDVLAKVAMKK